MKRFLKPIYAILIIGIMGVHKGAASAQETTNNNTTVNNSAAPAASSVTTGGTNINYQTNNAYNNDFAFGGGVVCRTPAMFMNANGGDVRTDNFDEFTTNGSRNNNFSGSVGITIPFGSTAVEDCKKMAKQLAKDRVISTELSLIKACVSLLRDGVIVDPVKFPSLEKCVIKKGEPNLTGKKIASNIQIKKGENGSSINQSKSSGRQTFKKSPLISTD